MTFSARASVERARTNWFRSYPDIILMILSIIQGLAFQDLALRAAELLPHFFDSLILPLHLLLCFVILVRIFQTYVAVALDYEAEFVSFVDFIQIFIVGILEYALFATMGHPFKTPSEPFSPERFYLYLGILLVLATAKYSFNSRLIAADRYISREEFDKERRLQLQNAIGSGILALVCVFSVFLAGQISILTAVPILAIIVLIVQTVNSLKKTFGIRAFVRQDWSMASMTDSERIATQVEDFKVSRSDMSVRNARIDDIQALIDLCQKMVPEFSELLGVSRATAMQSLEKILSAKQGTGSLFGWQRWRVVTNTKGVCIAAVLYLNLIEEKLFIKLLGESILIVNGSTDRFKERAEGCGLLRPFREDKGFLSAIFLVARGIDAASTADAILDADYIDRMHGTSYGGFIFRFRNNVQLSHELLSLASSHDSGAFATTTEAYKGIGLLDPFIGSQVCMVRIVRN